MKAQTVTILGLDRIGASIGLALKASSFELNIIGYDDDRDNANQAKELGAVDKVIRNLFNAATSADIVVLTMPFRELENTLKLIGDDLPPQTLVIDLGSLKTPALSWADEYVKRGHYVGASLVLAASMLTDSRLTTDAADAKLFEDSIFCVMPSPSAEPKAVETAVNFGRLLGATPFFLDPREYDSLMQGVETGPGLLSAAMFRAVQQSTGWRDILRFAGLPFALATTGLENEDLAYLALQDKDATLRWLDGVLEQLGEVRRWVAEGELERLELILDELSIERARWLHDRAKNDWTEDVDKPDLSEMGGIGGQFFGIFGRRGKDKSES
ncbi:MAG: prephenate dehydrogenase [Candidatus Promineifilaceae bacterium]